MDLYAVMGNPIEHSLSPAIYQAFAQQFQVALTCEKILVPDNQFDQCMRDFIARGGRGTGVTVPLKRIAYEWVHDQHETARKAKAVSMIHVRPNGITVGYNFDGIGLVDDIQKNFSYTMRDKKILILGAGGAVQGVLPVIMQQGAKKIVLANRTLKNAEAIATLYPSIEICFYPHLTETFDLIINGTSASLKGQSLPLPDDIVCPDTFCYDMMYAKQDTLFMTWAKTKGAKQVTDGLGMLVEHCANAFYVWFDKRPMTLPVLKLLCTMVSRSHCNRARKSPLEE